MYSGSDRWLRLLQSERVTELVRENASRAVPSVNFGRTTALETGDVFPA